MQSADALCLLAGSLDSEKGIYAMTFDKSFSRLLTAEADKSIKIYREDPESVCARAWLLGARAGLLGARAAVGCWLLGAE